MSVAFSDPLLSDFLRCKYKCYLKNNNTPVKENTVDKIYLEIEDRYKIRACEYIYHKYPNVDYAKKPRDILTALNNASNYYLNIFVKNDELSLHLDAVHRKESRSSSIKIFPMMFLPSEKINKVDKLELGVRSVILGHQLGVMPHSGILVHGRDYVAQRVQLQPLVSASEKGHS